MDHQAGHREQVVTRRRGVAAEQHRHRDRQDDGEPGDRRVPGAGEQQGEGGDRRDRAAEGGCPRGGVGLEVHPDGLRARDRATLDRGQRQVGQQERQQRPRRGSDGTGVQSPPRVRRQLAAAQREQHRQHRRTDRRDRREVPQDPDDRQPPRDRRGGGRQPGQVDTGPAAAVLQGRCQHDHGDGHDQQQGRRADPPMTRADAGLVTGSCRGGRTGRPLVKGHRSTVAAPRPAPLAGPAGRPRRARPGAPAGPGRVLALAGAEC